MVIQRSSLFRTLTGFHGGLRRGTAAVALGAVLVFVAGTPASNAVVFPSEIQSAETSDTPSTETVSSDAQVPGDAKGTPAPPSSAESKRGKPAFEPPATAPAPEGGPATADSGTPVPAAPEAPAAPETPGGAAAPPVTPPDASSRPEPAAGSSSPTPPYGSVHSYGSTTPQKQQLQQVAEVDPYGVSPLVWCGMGLVLLSGIAGAVFLRLRRS